MGSSELIRVEDLEIHYETDDGVVYALNGVSLHVKEGETLGLVGETGAGKTTLAKGILRLIPSPPGKIIGGKVFFEGEDILSYSETEMHKIRGNAISMVFQDPMTSLNPVMTVGDQIAEVIAVHNPDLGKEELRERVIAILAKVGISSDRIDEYPHQFSGGMKQRVVIAIALACNPKLLIADEPTTALDVTIQAQVLELMTELKEKYNTSMIMITHDLGIVAEVCDEVAVMYAGKIVEQGSLEEVFGETLHPYTEGLFNSLPNIKNRTAWLKPIHGLMPDPTDLPPGCAFAPRCNYATEECSASCPALKNMGGTHFVACSAYERDPDFLLERRRKNG